MPRATSYATRYFLELGIKGGVVRIPPKMISYHPRPKTPKTPRDSPSSGLAALHKLRHRPVAHRFGLERFHNRTDAFVFPQHAGVPPDTVLEDEGLGDQTGDEGNFPARRDHFDFGAGAGGVGRARLFGGAGEEVGGGGVEGGIADGEGDAGICEI